MIAPDQQQAFAEELLALTKDIPNNHGIEPQIIATLDKYLGGRLTEHGLAEDLGILLGWALDVHSLRVIAHKEEMDKRVAEWQARIQARRAKPCDDG